MIVGITKISSAAVNSGSTDVRSGMPLGGQTGEATGRVIGTPSVDASEKAEVVSHYGDTDNAKRRKFVEGNRHGKPPAPANQEGCENGELCNSSTARSKEQGVASEGAQTSANKNNENKKKQGTPWQAGAPVAKNGVPRGTVRSEAVIRSLAKTQQKLVGENDALKEKLVETEQLVAETMKIQIVDSVVEKKPDWDGVKEYVRLQFHKHAASPKRILNVFSNVNYLVSKFNLNLDTGYADKLDKIVYEEADRPVQHWSAWRQFLHDEYRDGIFDLRGRLKRLAIRVGASAILCGLILGPLAWRYRAVRLLRSLLPGFALGAVFALIKLCRTLYSARMQRQITWQDTCCEGTSLAPIDPDNSYDSSNSDGICKPAEYYVGFTICMPHLVTYRGCHHNEEVALVNRQLIRKNATPEVRAIAWGEASKLYLQSDFVKELPDMEDPAEGDVSKFLERYPAGRRSQLLNQLSKCDGATNWEVSGFVKTREILAKKNPEKSHPRFITNYPDTFLLNTIPFWIWQKRCVPLVTNIGLDRKITFTSGLDPLTIGEWVSTRERDGYYFYELDGSRFDGRVAVEAKEMLVEMYKRKHMPSTALKCFERTSSLSGRTKHGIRFQTSGTVGSGRIDTSSGDSHITAATITFAMARLGVEDWSVMINGDDNVLASRTFLPVSTLVTALNLLGHEMEVLYRPDVDRLEYCSSRFWPIGDGRRVLGPKLGRLLAKGFMIHTPMARPQTLPHLVSVAKGYYHYRWMPGLDVILSGLGVTHFSNSQRLEFQTTLNEEITVDQGEVESAFVALYGFNADELRSILRNLPFSTIPTEGGIVLSHPLLDRICEIDGMIDTQVEGMSYLSRWSF